VRAAIKRARKRGAFWVRLYDLVKLAWSAEGRASLWTQLAHRSSIHQTTAYTCEDRYPDLFDLVARLSPKAERILSFGCSTGEELLSLRRHFPEAEIVGVEINPRSRRLAKKRLAHDGQVTVIRPWEIIGSFDVVFALAVLQREPHRVAETDMTNIAGHYPFAKFDAAVTHLVHLLRPSGLLGVMHAHYRVEDSSAAAELEPITPCPALAKPLFSPTGHRANGLSARSLFRKRAGPRSLS